MCAFLFLLIDKASAVQKKIVAPSKEKRPCEVVGNCVLRESSCFLLLIHTRARGYLLTLKCLRASFRDAVRHEAEGPCSKMVSEKNIGRMRLNAVDIARRGLQLTTVCGMTTNTTNTNSTKMKSLLLGDIRSKSIVPSTTAQWIEAFVPRFVLWPVAVVPTRIRNNGCDDRNRSDLSLRTAKPSFPDGSYIHITKFVPRASIMRGEMNLQKHLYTQSIS